MPKKAPRFPQKPSIKQTADGHLLMECNLEAQPPPKIKWSHGQEVVQEGGRYVMKLEPKDQDLYLASLLIKDPTAADGGAYKCTASNELGESNANINLNFAGQEETKGKAPTFVGKPKIIPKDGGAIILLECRVKSATKPTAHWFKAGERVNESGRFNKLMKQ
uniref:Ig-like domain-containing protein n=1 Tax=Romanomermis culicivorax TaxID=13658 RepID=A0A915K807_ROMCU